MTARYDVVDALESVAPFRDDETGVRSLAYPRPPDRARPVAAFLDGYGVDGPFDAVGEVAAGQERAARTVPLLADQGRRPQLDWVAAACLQELAGRMAWTRADRHRFG
jgi:hypothetical protein